MTTPTRPRWTRGSGHRWCPPHSRRQVTRRIDVEPWRDLLTDGDRAARGRTAEDPGRVMKRPLLPFHDPRADREVMAAAQVHVACRSVLDRSLTSRVPGPSWRSPWRTRVGVPRAQARCAQVVRRCGRRPGRTALLRTPRRRLAGRPPSQPPALVTPRPSRGRRPPGPRGVRPTGRALLDGWARAQRVLADRDDPDRPGAACRRSGGPVWHAGGLWRWVSARPPCGRRPCRAHGAHPPARQGRRGAGDPDAAAAADEAPGPAVAAVASAGMGGNGEVVRALRAPEGLGLAVDVPPPAPAETRLCGPEACVLDAPQAVGTGPGGPPTAPQARRAHHPGWTCVVARRHWAGCPRPARGLAPRPQPTGRRVITPADPAEDDAARARAKTPGDAAVRQHHPRVDRQRAARGRDHDGRRRRSWGPWRVTVPSRLTGLVVHVTRRVTHLRPQGAPPAWPPVSASCGWKTHVVRPHARRRTPPSCPSGTSRRRCAGRDWVCLTWQVECSLCAPQRLFKHSPFD